MTVIGSHLTQHSSAGRGGLKDRGKLSCDPHALSSTNALLCQSKLMKRVI